MESSEKMEISETESPDKSEDELASSSLKEKESPSETQPSHQLDSSKVEQESQELASKTVVSSTEEDSQVKSPQATSLSPATSALTIEEPPGTKNCPAPKKHRLDYKSMSTGVYLDSTVVPILHVALVTLDRLRPADPVQYVIDFLLKNKVQYSKKIPSEASTNQD